MHVFQRQYSLSLFFYFSFFLHFLDNKKLQRPQQSPIAYLDSEQFQRLEPIQPGVLSLGPMKPLTITAGKIKQGKLLSVPQSIKSGSPRGFPGGSEWKIHDLCDRATSPPPPLPKIIAQGLVIATGGGVQIQSIFHYKYLETQYALFKDFPGGPAADSNHFRLLHFVPLTGKAPVWLGMRRLCGCQGDPKDRLLHIWFCKWKLLSRTQRQERRFANSPWAKLV
ncbi:hypothetical protein MJT46_007402 [Ovis ammon polii x Ovis aries]|nr:hypothetical protein MJT46_007402 [Ovis ammon polii x Ovis aries]